jgi:hypothetical protein
VLFSAEKYCAMLQEENVNEILETVICEPGVDNNVKTIGQKVVSLVVTGVNTDTCDSMKH